MSIIRVGATKKYSDNWDSVFGKGKKSQAAPTAAKTKLIKTKSAKPKAAKAKQAAGKKKKSKK